MASLRKTQAGGVKKRSGDKRNHLRQQEDDDCVLVEPEEPADWILQQLRGGASSHTPGRRYFNILYEDKDEAKEYGARWDVQAREWYAKNGRAAQRLAAMWGEMGLIPKVMFDVPAAESADAKELGARFCWERKKWFATDMVTVRKMQEYWTCLTRFTDPQTEAHADEAPTAPLTPPKPRHRTSISPALRPATAHAQAQRGRAEEHNGGGGGNTQCVICWQSAKSVGFLHQGQVHVCACTECGAEWFRQRGTCPMCRQPAECTVTVFS